MLGEAHGIPELAEPELPLEQIDGHVLAMIGSGVCHADAYYRCAYEGGAAFVLIKDANFPSHPDAPLARLATAFPQAISSVEIPDHRLALTGWLDYYGIGGLEEGDALVVREGGEVLLRAVFDVRHRLTNLEVMLGSGTGR
jgi:hypothetical protein